MTKKLLTSYAFTPGAANAGTLVVSGAYELEQFLLVTNVTTGATIYQFNSPAKGGTVSSAGGNTTLTLEYNTSTMSSGDRLQIFVEDGLSLPSGAATAANQATANTSLASIDGKLPALSSGRLPVDIGAPSVTIGASVEISNDVGNPIPVSDAGGSLTVDDGGNSLTVDGTVGVSGTVAVSATALPLPSGAATSANQATANTSLASLDGKAPSLVSGRVPVDGSGVTQPVSGTVAVSGTTAVSAASLPLPTGAATAAKQPALGTAGVASTDVITVQGIASGTPQPISGSVSVTGTPSVTVSGTAAVSAVSLPLPTGAATETTLSTLSGKIPASLTVTSARLLVDGSGVTQPVSGSVSVSGTAAVSAASLPLPTGAATAANQPALGTAGTPSADVLTVQGATSMTALKVDGSGVTQPVSGSVTVSGTVTASGPLTDTQLRATAVPVSGTITANAGTNLNTSALALETGGNLASLNAKVPSSLTVKAASTAAAATDPALVVAVSPNNTVPISAAALPLPSGASTAANQSTTNASLANIYADLGAPADAAASSDTGTFSIIALVKRGLQNWTTLLGRVPTLSLGAQAQSAALAVSPANKLTVTGPAAQSAINTDLITGNVNGWYDAAGYNYVSFTIIPSAGISSGAFQIEATNDTVNDASGSVCPSFVDNGSSSSTISVTSLSITASVNQRRGCYLASRYVRVRLNSGTVGGTVQCVANFSNAPTDCPGLIKRIDIATIGTSSVSLPSINGTAPASLTTVSVSGYSNTDHNAGNVAAASGSLTAVTNAINFATLTFDVNLIAFTAGSSTGLDLYLQESPDNGTTFYDIWQCEAFTAVGRARIPAIPVNGRRRFRWVNRTGAASAATLTVNSIGTSAAVPIQRQFFDRTSGVGSGTAVVSTSSAAYDIAGCKQFTVVMQAGTATSVGSFQAQMSMDGTNWYNASAATAIGATTANNTIIPITSGLTGRFIRVTCTAAGTTQVINAIHIYGTN